MKPLFNVALTCVGGRLTHDLIVALRKASDFDVNIVGLDVNANANGRFLCDRFFTIPNAEEDQKGWLERLLKIHSETNFTSFIPLSEAEVKLTAAYNSVFEKYKIVTSVSDNSVVNVVNDKFKLMSDLRAKGIAVGAFHSIDSTADLIENIKHLGYPNNMLVLKPRAGRGSRGVMIIDAKQDSFKALLPNRFCGHGSVEKIIEAFHENNIGFKDCILMPHYTGDVYDVDCVVNRGVAWSITARRRQLTNALWPTSTGHISSTNPIVIKYVETIIKALSMHGAADFDIIVSDDGVPFIIDGACRLSGSVGVSCGAGVNVPAELLRLMYGLKSNGETLTDGVAFRPFITMAAVQPAFAEDLSDVQF